MACKDLEPVCVHSPGLCLLVGGSGGLKGKGSTDYNLRHFLSHLLFLTVLSCKIHGINLASLRLPFVSSTAARSLKQRRERTEGGTCAAFIPEFILHLN